MNQLIIIGNLGSNPEVKQFDNGSITTFSVATTERWKGRDGQDQERTEWHRVVVRGRDAPECARVLKKGSRVIVIGNQRTREYEKDGAKQRAVELVAFHVGLAINALREGAPARAAGGGAGPAKGGGDGDGYGDIPFASCNNGSDYTFSFLNW